MTDESICVRCAELVKVRVRRRGKDTLEEEELVCSVEAIRDIVLYNDDVQECSRFVKVPKFKKLPRPEGIWIRKNKNGKLTAVGREEAARRDAEDLVLRGMDGKGKKASRSPRPRYLPHDKEN